MNAHIILARTKPTPAQSGMIQKIRNEGYIVNYGFYSNGTIGLTMLYPKTGGIYLNTIDEEGKYIGSGRYVGNIKDNPQISISNN